jgi:hypothetical protein
LPKKHSAQSVKQSKIFQFSLMKELLDKLKAEGLTEAQAIKAVEIMKNFAKSKFPLFGGAIDKIFEKYNKPQEEDFMP